MRTPVLADISQNNPKYHLQYIGTCEIRVVERLIDYLCYKFSLSATVTRCILDVRNTNEEFMIPEP